MDALSVKELNVRNTESLISQIKDAPTSVQLLFAEQLNLLSNHAKRSEHVEVIAWILAALEGDTEQREVDKLSEEQAQYASLLVSAVSDCANIGV